MNPADLKEIVANVNAIGRDKFMAIHDHEPAYKCNKKCKAHPEHGRPDPVEGGLGRTFV